MNAINWGFLGQCTVAAILIYLAGKLWVKAIGAAEREEKKREQREEVLWEQRTLLAIAEYITQREARKAEAQWGLKPSTYRLPPTPDSDEIAFALDEPDLEFQLRRSIELNQERASGDSAA